MKNTLFKNNGHRTARGARRLMAAGLTLLMASGLASCVNDDALDTFRPDATTTFSVDALPGYKDNPNNATRAGIADYGKTNWAKGDSLAVIISFNEGVDASSTYGVAFAYAIYTGSAWKLGDGLTTATSSSFENLPDSVRGGKVMWPVRAKSITAKAYYAPRQMFNSSGELSATTQNLGKGERWAATATTVTTPGAPIVFNGWTAQCFRLRVAAVTGDVVKLTAPGFVPTGETMAVPLGEDGFLTATADLLGNAYFYGNVSGETTVTIILTNSILYGTTPKYVFQKTREFPSSTGLGTGNSYAVNTLADTEFDGFSYIGTVAGLDASKDVWFITDKAPDYNALSTKLKEVDSSRRISITMLKATDVGKKAFYQCANLASITMPTATYVGYDAFCDCVNLASIKLPAATIIDQSAFFGCTNLTSIELPAATKIGSNVFAKCASLTSIELPAATGIGNTGFYGCTNLNSIELPAATSIGDGVFDKCTNLTSIAFGTPITDWGFNALGNIKTKNITLTLSPKQRVLAWDSSESFLPTDATFTDFGLGKMFCGAASTSKYTFKEIKKAE